MSYLDADWAFLYAWPAMLGAKRNAWTVALAVGIGGLAPGGNLRAEARSAPPQTVLLLANNKVLSGVVERQGDRYRVRQPSGVLFVPAVDILHVAGSIDGLYAFLRGRIAANAAIDHLRLARWCLHQRLHGYAAREILDARRLEPHHPAIGRMERELELRVQGPTAAAQRRSVSDRNLPRATPPGRNVVGRTRSRRRERDRQGTSAVNQAWRGSTVRRDRAATGGPRGSRTDPSHGPRRGVPAATTGMRPLGPGANAVRDPFDPDPFNRRYAAGHAPHDE